MHTQTMVEKNGLVSTNKREMIQTIIPTNIEIQFNQVKSFW